MYSFVHMSFVVTNLQTETCSGRYIITYGTRCKLFSHFSVIECLLTHQTWKLHEIRNEPVRLRASNHKFYMSISTCEKMYICINQPEGLLTKALDACGGRQGLVLGMMLNVHEQ